MTLDAANAATGFVVGLLVGLTGVGGGSLMTPALILLFGIHPVTAVGTDLLQASVTKAVGTLVHGARKTVDWPIVLRLASGSVPATVLTLVLLQAIGAKGGISSTLISTVLGFCVLLTAICVAFRPQILRFAGARIPAPEGRRLAGITIGTGVVLGVLVSLTSIGAGAIGVTVLLLLYPRLPTATVVGSDIAHAVPLTLIAGLGHLWIGTVNGSLLVSLLAGSVPGIVVGSLLASRVPDLVLRPLLAAVLVVVGARLVF